ncbi:MAG: YcnI family protein [Pseudolabrys sp.]|nr:YcnI family protein [Pseudolabrys sp.]
MSLRMIRISAFVTAAVSLPSLAFAHVTLEQREASIGSSVKLTFKVPHGCDGSPTQKLRVRIPDGVIAVKPMPKAGWTLDVTSGKYDKTYEFFHGAKLSEGVKEITWTGNLPDQYYDEFVVSGFLAADLKPGVKLSFPVVQECEKGVSRWIEIPADGKETKEPAPAILLTPKK